MLILLVLEPTGGLPARRIKHTDGTHAATTRRTTAWSHPYGGPVADAVWVVSRVAGWPARARAEGALLQDGGRIGASQARHCRFRCAHRRIRTTSPRSADRNLNS